MKFSKLELRAKVIDIINRLNLDDSEICSQSVLVDELKNLDAYDLVVQTLIKELNSDEEEKIKKVSFLLLEMNSLEHSKEPLWTYIRSEEVSDRVKEASCILLKSLGEQISADDLLDYMEDPQKLIDTETQKLLETALSNPEAQIDLIDFMSAVAKEEQISLIKSLVYDYPGDSLSNILSTVIESMDDLEIKELCINILSETKSYNSLAVLEDILKYSEDERLKKLASISLKKLKLLGVVSANKNYGNRGKFMCRDTKAYKFFTTYPDGVGNQCVVSSRIDANGLLSVFNTIIDDIEGIADCFGFYCITEFDFEKILDRLENQSRTVEISPEYAKKMLVNAEVLSKKNQYSLPYEYSCWKHMLYDIVDFELEKTFDENIKKWGDEIIFADYKMLEMHKLFNSWFFEESDNEASKKMIERFFDVLKQNENPSFEQIETIIDESFSEVFDSSQLEIYFNRLKICANLLNLEGEIALRNSVSFVANELKTLDNDALKEVKFLQNILKKTVLESLLRELNKYNKDKNTPATIFTNHFVKQENKISEEKLNFVIDLLAEKWSSY